MSNGERLRFMYKLQYHNVEILLQVKVLHSKCYLSKSTEVLSAKCTLHGFNQYIYNNNASIDSVKTMRTSRELSA